MEKFRNATKATPVLDCQFQSAALVLAGVDDFDLSSYPRYLGFPVNEKKTKRSRLVVGNQFKLELFFAKVLGKSNGFE